MKSSCMKRGPRPCAGVFHFGAAYYSVILAVMQKTVLMRVILPALLLLCAGLVSPILAADEHAPSGLPAEHTTEIPQLEDITVTAIEIPAQTEPEHVDLLVPAYDTAEKDTTKKEEEPKPEPMVLGGAAAVAAGTGLAVAGAFGSPVLLLIAALCFAGGAFLTALGWKKIKAEPKKYSGEKIAIANYIVIGVIGVLASFYSLYILFTV